MEKIIPCSLKDQEVFQRVWQRVVSGREDCGCPIEAIPHGMEGDISCQRLEELVGEFFDINTMDLTLETRDPVQVSFLLEQLADQF